MKDSTPNTKAPWRRKALPWDLIFPWELVRIDKVKEEVEEECTGDNIEVDHDSTGLIHSL